jgi:hypothetical protein
VIKAYIADNFMADGVDIFITDSGEGHRRLLHVHGPFTVEWENISDDSVVPNPTITLSAEAARALLDQLSRHYEGASDMRTLRKDYEFERDRREELVRVLIGIAEKATPDASASSGHEERGTTSSSTERRWSDHQDVPAEAHACGFGPPKKEAEL